MSLRLTSSKSTLKWPTPSKPSVGTMLELGGRNTGTVSSAVTGESSRVDRGLIVRADAERVIVDGLLSRSCPWPFSRLVVL